MSLSFDLLVRKELSSGVAQLTWENLIYGLLIKCEVKIAAYWPSSFLLLFMDRDEVEAQKLAKKNEANVQ